MLLNTMWVAIGEDLFFKQHNMAFGERGSYYIVNIFLIEGEGKNN